MKGKHVTCKYWLCVCVCAYVYVCVCVCVCVCMGGGGVRMWTCRSLFRLGFGSLLCNGLSAQDTRTHDTRTQTQEHMTHRQSNDSSTTHLFPFHGRGGLFYIIIIQTASIHKCYSNRCQADLIMPALHWPAAKARSANLCGCCAWLE